MLLEAKSIIYFNLSAEDTQKVINIGSFNVAMLLIDGGQTYRGPGSLTNFTRYNYPVFFIPNITAFAITLYNTSNVWDSTRDNLGFNFMTNSDSLTIFKIGSNGYFPNIYFTGLIAVLS